MGERTLLQFPRSPVLHIAGDVDPGWALCGKSGIDAAPRGFLRDHGPYDKPICKRCKAEANPSFEDLAHEGGLAG